VRKAASDVACISLDGKRSFAENPGMQKPNTLLLILAIVVSSCCFCLTAAFPFVVGTVWQIAKIVLVLVCHYHHNCVLSQEEIVSEENYDPSAAPDDSVSPCIRFCRICRRRALNTCRISSTAFEQLRGELAEDFSVRKAQRRIWPGA
jgi:hypothetical protein